MKHVLKQLHDTPHDGIGTCVSSREDRLYAVWEASAPPSNRGAHRLRSRRDSGSRRPCTSGQGEPCRPSPRHQPLAVPRRAHRARRARRTRRTNLETDTDQLELGRPVSSQSAARVRPHRVSPGGPTGTWPSPVEPAEAHFTLTET